MSNELGPMAGLSHEIRTPLVSVLGMAQLLATTPLSDEQRQLLQGIFDGGETLLATLDGMIELGKLEAGLTDLVIAPWEVRPWLIAACDLLRPQAEAKGLTLDVSCDAAVPVQVLGDAGRVRQVLLNLLTNAIRHSDHGGIDVRLTWQESSSRKPSQLVLSVQDHGEGIDDEMLARLFSPLLGVKPATRGRAGLGLAICRRLATCLGGDIWVLSSAGEGCTFYLSLPAAADRSVVAEPLPANQSARFDPGFATEHPLSIMIVDDDPVNRQVIAMFLDRLGYTTRSAAGGEEALKALEEHALDLILLDIEMPGMSGTDLAKVIRRNHAEAPRPYLAAVTAHVLDDAPDRLGAMGMDDFLGKPFRVEALRALLLRAEQRKPRTPTMTGLPGMG